MDLLIDPFLENDFMLRALAAGVLVAIACAVIGAISDPRHDRNRAKLNPSAISGGVIKGP